MTALEWFFFESTASVRILATFFHMHTYKHTNTLMICLSLVRKPCPWTFFALLYCATLLRLPYLFALSLSLSCSPLCPSSHLCFLQLLLPQSSGPQFLLSKLCSLLVRYCASCSCSCIIHAASPNSSSFSIAHPHPSPDCVFSILLLGLQTLIKF